jgi:hypothetical protein
MYSIVCVSLSYDTRNVFSLFSVKYMGSCPLNRKKGTGLRLDMSSLQEPLLLVGCVCTTEAVMHLDLSTPQGPELHPDSPGKQEADSELHLDVSTRQGLRCIWT